MRTPYGKGLEKRRKGIDAKFSDKPKKRKKRNPMPSRKTYSWQRGMEKVDNSHQK